MRSHSLIGGEPSLPRLSASADVLAALAVTGRRRRFVPNQVSGFRQMYLLVRSAHQSRHFAAIILWIPSALSCIAEHRDLGHGVVRSAARCAGLIIILGAFLVPCEMPTECTVASLCRLAVER